MFIINDKTKKNRNTADTNSQHNKNKASPFWVCGPTLISFTGN